MSGIAREPLARQLQQGTVAMPGVTVEARERLLDYLAMLHRWNRIYNLSAVRAPRDMVVRHLLDSLAVLPHVRGASLLDVGSGAGLPGLPLALCRSDLEVTLLDSNGKKARFLRQVVAELGLGNVAVVQERAEAYRPPRTFDCIISRAYARLDTFVRQVSALLAPDGLLLAMKGRFNPVAEAPGLEDRLQVVPLAVPGLAEERCLVRLSAAAISGGGGR